MIRRLKPKSQFSRNVLTLLTGTTIAQSVPIAVMPILTRLYTPEDFGLLALFLSITAILTVFATARYELAIMMPKDNTEASNIFWLVILISLLISFILLIIVLLFGEHITVLLANKEIGPWLYLIPISVFLTGCYQAFNYWNTRNKMFSDVAKSKVINSTLISGTQLTIGMTPNNSMGLLGGVIAGQFGSTLYLANKVRKDNHISPFALEDSINMAIKYKKFPLVSTWGALFDRLAQQMPIFMLIKYYSVNVTGQFSLTFRVLNLPMTLIGTSISQVLYQKIVEIYQYSPEKLKSYIIRFFILLCIPMIPMIIVLNLWGESLFLFVFGKEWRMAGALAATLSIAVAVRFAVSPLSMVLAMDHNLKLGTLWQAIYLLTLTTTLIVAVRYELETFVLIFVIHEVFLYLIYFVFILKGCDHIRINKEGVK